ncbi:ATP-binding cassette domain-containing protein [Pistricoccus aurantiacus]|uniref:ATP-binding cassette domain-containing protein n=1 Tax=Pistricoccus aurantiacus TaxID=1883414 RepID=A0A5B8SNB5_9GAMM|nr:ATP-binding cassette domain-containing protein [Pistricoccus aurantiacus]QEA37664.1 ATP-binding cassette domain-containing protein [Pistricoccus aurantiacus]
MSTATVTHTSGAPGHKEIPILSLVDITKRFPGVIALNKVSFDVRAGEVHALLGENGAGKSTLMKVLAGKHKPNGGKILLEGKKKVFDNPKKAKQSGIVLIHQEQSLVPDMSVAENIFLGNLPKKWGNRIDWKTLHRESTEILDRLKCSFSSKDMVSDLSIAKKQMVEIARALVFTPKVVVFDEPTASLTDHEKPVLYDIINTLREQGVGIVYISHRMDEIFHLSQRISVLRDGEYNGTVNTVDTNEDEVTKLMIGRSSGRYGIAWNAARGTPLGHTFTFLMAKFGQPIINLRRIPGGYDFQDVSGEQLRPMFQSDAAFRACEYMLDILKYSPPNILNMAWYERAQSYASGESCMAYNYTLLAPLFELNQKSPAWGNTGYLPHPVGNHGLPITPIGGYALAIPSNLSEERVEAVWAALQSLTSASLSKLYIMNGSLVTPRFSVSRDPEVSSLSPVIGVVDEMARNNILQAWPRPPVPHMASIITIAGQEIHDVLSDRCSIKQALTSAQKKADKLLG